MNGTSIAIVNSPPLPQDLIRKQTKEAMQHAVYKYLYV